jgi:hypothetical protein
MAATIKIKNSSTTGAVPTASDLVQGELAVNVADLGLYTENASGTIVKLNAPSIDDKNTGATKNLTISTAGNLGLGVTPFANSLSKGLDWVSGAGVFGSSNNAYWTANAYYDSAWKYKATAAAAFLGMESGSFRFNIAASGTAGNAITFTEAMRLDASGNLIVGGTTTFGGGASWTKSFTVNGSTGSTSDAGVDIIGYRTGNGDVGGLGFLNAASSNARIATIYGERSGADNSGILGFHTMSAGTSAERARIDSIGNLLVGTTSGTSKLVVTTTTASGAAITFDGSVGNGILMKTTYASATGGTYISFSNSAGTATGNISQTGTTTVAYTTSSDYRLKENIIPMTGALARVTALNPVTYTWKADGSAGEGFIAHELQAVVPDAVVGEKDAVDEEGNPVYQGIDTSFLVATLTAAIQELKAEFDAYKATHP